jgi:hypothetical protein
MKKEKQSIGKIETINPFSKEELMEREYQQKKRELKIGRMRANVLKSQTTKAYEIIENIRFDYLGDTMFRGYFVEAKKALEGAMSDFLLSDSYWEKAIDKHKKMTPEEYNDYVIGNDKQPLN